MLAGGRGGCSESFVDRPPAGAIRLGEHRRFTLPPTALRRAEPALRLPSDFIRHPDREWRSCLASLVWRRRGRVFRRRNGYVPRRFRFLAVLGRLRFAGLPSLIERIDDDPRGRLRPAYRLCRRWHERIHDNPWHGWSRSSGIGAAAIGHRFAVAVVDGRVECIIWWNGNIPQAIEGSTIAITEPRQAASNTTVAVASLCGHRGRQRADSHEQRY